MKKIYWILLILLIVITVSFTIFYLKNKSTISINNSEGKSITVNVLIADTDEEKTKGLAILNELPTNSGMLFLNNSDVTHPFWMLDMKFPIDIIFLDSSKKINYIYQNAQPCVNQSLCKLITPENPYRYVLEVNSGYVAGNNIKVGDQISW